MLTLAFIFIFILLFNLAPAFTPPTWIVLAYLKIAYNPNSLLLAFVGALGATCGRLLLAKLSTLLLRKSFLSQKTVKNIDVIKERLERHKKFTIGLFLFYSFSPLPSNQLFLAYGLTNLNLSMIALPFFIGRFLSYLFWIVTASRLSLELAARTLKDKTFLSSYFFVAQILTLVVVYLFAKIDWQMLIKEKKLRLIRK